MASVLIGKLKDSLGEGMGFKSGKWTNPLNMTELAPEEDDEEGLLPAS